MAKKSQAVRNSTKPALPVWVWLITAFAAGMLLAFALIYRDNIQTSLPAPDAKASREKIADISTDTPSAEKPKYDFYNVLPEREVAIPDAELSARNAAPTPPVESPNVRYFLQIGSFPGEDVAEAMKAQLALSGVQAQMSKVDIKGKTWFRLRTGPFADSRALEAAKGALAASNVSAVAVREAIAP
jgi:cell division protein FtsN